MRSCFASVVRVICALSSLLVVPAYGQTGGRTNSEHLAFEVASVKPNTSAGAASTIGFEPGGRFRAINEPVSRLIQEAYATAASPRPKLMGGPSWIDSDRFDVEAVTSASSSRDRSQEMLRTLLADRFRLLIHHETRELPTYNLIRLRREKMDLSHSRS